MKSGHLQKLSGQLLSESIDNEGLDRRKGMKLQVAIANMLNQSRFKFNSGLIPQEFPLSLRDKIFVKRRRF